MINELTSLLGSTSPPEKFLSKIELGVAAPENLPSKSCLRYLEKHAQHPQEFLKKFEELREKKVDRLGSFMQVIQFISADKPLKEYLSKHCGSVENSNLSRDDITADDLPQIQKKLMKAAVEGDRKRILQANSLSKRDDDQVIN